MTRNVAASVHGRLLHLARSRGVDFNALLDRYALERLLYRMSVSEHAGAFVLKGAQLLLTYTDGAHRPTRDLDLLGLGREDAEALAEDFRDICGVGIDDDGVVFDPGSIEVRAIREVATHGGQRVRLVAHLGTARVRLQVDVGFGDVITPEPEWVTFPTLLDAPEPRLHGYPLATVVAEKLEALSSLGLATSRMKDVYDLWFVLTRFELDEADLQAAIRRTFAQRGTSTNETPAAFTARFWYDADKRQQWATFVRRSQIDAPSLEDACQVVLDALQPLMADEAS